MELEFTGEVWFWKGPAPWFFVTVPEGERAAIESASPEVSYGWGMIPVLARVGDTQWTTSLWPKDGAYVVPVKASDRRAEGLEEGDAVTVRLSVEL